MRGLAGLYHQPLSEVLSTFWELTWILSSLSSFVLRWERTSTCMAPLPPFSSWMVPLLHLKFLIASGSFYCDTGLMPLPGPAPLWGWCPQPHLSRQPLYLAPLQGPLLCLCEPWAEQLFWDELWCILYGNLYDKTLHLNRTRESQDWGKQRRGGKSVVNGLALSTFCLASIYLQVYKRNDGDEEVQIDYLWHVTPNTNDCLNSAASIWLKNWTFFTKHSTSLFLLKITTVTTESLPSNHSHCDDCSGLQIALEQGCQCPSSFPFFSAAMITKH